MDEDEVVHEESGADVGAVWTFDDEPGAVVGAESGTVVAIDAEFDGLESGLASVVEDVLEHLLSESATVPVGIEVEFVEEESGAVRAG